MKDAPPASALGRDLGQPDGGFYCFNLAKKRADGVEVVVSPVLQQAGGFGRDLPVPRVRDLAPLVHMTTQLVNDGRGVVLLVFVREALFILEGQIPLLGRRPLLFLRLGDGGEELGLAPVIDDLLGGLALFIQLPVAGGVLVGRVENRVVEKFGGHFVLRMSVLIAALGLYAILGRVCCDWVVLVTRCYRITQLSLLIGLD